VRFRGKKDILPLFPEGLAVVRFASGVCPRGFEIGDAHVQGRADERHGRIFFAERAQDPLAAQSQAGYLDTGVPQDGFR
jgi:hypothetical protein